MEIETHRTIALRLGHISSEQNAALQTHVEEVGRMLNALIQSLRKKQNAARLRLHVLNPNP